MVVLRTAQSPSSPHKLGHCCTLLCCEHPTSQRTPPPPVTKLQLLGQFLALSEAQQLEPWGQIPCKDPESASAAPQGTEANTPREEQERPWARFH